MKTVLEEFEDDFIAKDDDIEMKCINCGYEEKMPDWVYGGEALFLKRKELIFSSTDRTFLLNKQYARHSLTSCNGHLFYFINASMISMALDAAPLRI